MEQKKAMPIYEVLTEDHKTFLDDLPDKAVEWLFSLSPDTIVGINLAFTVSDDGVVKQNINFDSDQVLEALDYLEYLMINEYRPWIGSKPNE